MEVIHYLREVRQLMSPADKIEKLFYDCFYFPNLNVLIYQESNHHEGEKDHEIIKTGPIIKEAQYIAKGKKPENLDADVYFTNIRRMHCNENQIKSLIEIAELKKQLKINFLRMVTSLEERLKHSVPIILP